jgi:bifunctional DNase/RNase
VIELELVDLTARPIPEERRRRMREDLEARVRQDIEAHGKQQVPAPVVVDMPSVEHHVRLKEKAGHRVLEIGIGQPEAMAIGPALQGARQPRPMTHDLIGDLLRVLDDVSVLRVVITKLEQETTPPPPTTRTPTTAPPGTFFAELELQHREQLIKVDCRPSDGIAVAVRLGLPIIAADALEPVLVTA